MTISGKQFALMRHRLAGQPFQRAVRADMDDRVDAERLAQPQAEGDEFVARRQGRVVIVGAAIGRTAAIGSERDGDVAEGRGAEGEAMRSLIRLAPLWPAGHLPARGEIRAPTLQPPPSSPEIAARGDEAVPVRGDGRQCPRGA